MKAHAQASAKPEKKRTRRPNAEKTTLTPYDVSKILQVPINFVQKLVRDGILVPCSRGTGRKMHRRFKRADLDTPAVRKAVSLYRYKKWTPQRIAESLGQLQLHFRLTIHE